MEAPWSAARGPPASANGTSSVLAPLVQAQYGAPAGSAAAGLLPPAVAAASAADWSSWGSTPAAAPGRGEFAAGFLWFDAMPGYASGPVKPEAVAAAPLPMPPMPLPAGACAAAGRAAMPPPLVPVAQPQPGEHLQQQKQHGAQATAASRKGRAAAAEEERRARNRATQARFRERQKARNEQLAAEHSATEAELARTHCQQEELRATNSVLQKLLTVRDGALAVLRAGAPGQPTQPPLLTAAEAAAEADQLSAAANEQHMAAAAAPAAAPPAAPPAGAAEPGGEPAAALERPASGASLSSSIQQQMGWLGHELTAHMAMLDLPATAHPDEHMAAAHERLTPILSQQIAPMLRSASSGASGEPSAGASSSGAAAASGPTVSGSAACDAYDAAVSDAGGSPRPPGGPPIGVEAMLRDRPELARRVIGWTAEEFVADWAEKARALKDLLAEYDGRGDEGALDRLVEVFRSWGGTLSLTLHFKPDNAQALFATAGGAPPGTWDDAAELLAPTAAQRSKLRQLWHSYAGRTQAICAERTAAMQAVHHAAEAARCDSTPGACAAAGTLALPVRTLNGLMAQYLSLFDAAGRLSSLRDAEVVAVLQLMGRMGAVLSPLQKARCVAACHPYFPDTVQIARRLAADSEQLSDSAHTEQVDGSRC